MKKRPDYQKVVFISDMHIPFHDKQAVKACLSFIKWYNPHTIIFLGDVIDFYAISSFSKDPARALDIQNEIDETIETLNRFCKIAPDAKKIFLKGNHCHRLQRYLWTKASELSGLRDLTIPKLLKLDEMGIVYEKSGKLIWRKTVIKHGNIVRKFSAYTAKNEFESCGISGISGHTHRLGYHFRTNMGGAYSWMECGCLCDLEPEYMEGKITDWQQGFGIGFYKNMGSSRFNTNIVPIIKGKAMFGGWEFY